HPGSSRSGPRHGDSHPPHHQGFQGKTGPTGKELTVFPSCRKQPTSTIGAVVSLSAGLFPRASRITRAVTPCFPGFRQRFFLPIARTMAKIKEGCGSHIGRFTCARTRSGDVAMNLIAKVLTIVNVVAAIVLIVLAMRVAAARTAWIQRIDES